MIFSTVDCVIPDKVARGKCMNRHECVPTIVTLEIEKLSILIVDKPKFKFIGIKPYPHTR